MKNYVPNAYVKDILGVDYHSLKEAGIKCLIFDLDNTIAPVWESMPSKEIVDFFDKLKSMNFTIFILTDALKCRSIFFEKALGVKAYSFSRKPSNKNYIKIINQLNLTPKEICAIGDQINTDILGANKMGMFSILVDPISNKEFPTTYIKRMNERKILEVLRRENMFTKDEYFQNIPKKEIISTSPKNVRAKKPTYKRYTTSQELEKHLCLENNNKLVNYR